MANKNRPFKRFRGGTIENDKYVLNRLNILTQEVKKLFTGTAAAGNSTEVQFNTGGVLDANSGFTFDKTLNALSLNNPTLVPPIEAGFFVESTAKDKISYLRPGYFVVLKNGNSAQSQTWTFREGGSGSRFDGYKGRGTYGGVVNPLLSQDQIVQFTAQGYDGAAYKRVGEIEFAASADLATGGGGQMKIWLKTNGEVNQSLKHTFHHDGSITLHEYGVGNNTATALTKTPSVYLAHFATDGTLLEPEGLEYNESSGFLRIIKDSGQATFYGQSYGSPSAIWLRRANGTRAATTGVLSGDKIGVVGMEGRRADGSWSNSSARMEFFATQDHLSSVQQGQRIDFVVVGNSNSGTLTSLTLEENTNVRLNAYGIGNKDATTLAKTRSIYLSGYATDGTFLEVEMNGDFADDTAAGVGSVPVGGLYFNTTTGKLHTRMT